MIFENLILEVNIFGSKIISILLNDIENFQKSSYVYKKNQCYLAKWTLFSIRNFSLQELNFQKSKKFDDKFLKSCPEFQSFRLSKKYFTGRAGGQSKLKKWSWSSLCLHSSAAGVHQFREAAQVQARFSQPTGFYQATSSDRIHGACCRSVRTVLS